jgi:hypothetical protein
MNTHTSSNIATRSLYLGQRLMLTILASSMTAFEEDEADTKHVLLLQSLMSAG